MPASSIRHNSVVRWLKRLGVILVSLVALLLLSSFFVTNTSYYKKIPESVWASRDPDLIREHLSRSNSYDVTTRLPSYSVPLSTSDAPASLVNGANLWVKAVNDYNPDAILAHETDRYGNLYVVFGAWWLELKPDEKVKALDGLGIAWRHYLSTNFAQWDGSDGFAPGIIVVDEEGEVARNLDGKIELFR